MNYRLSARIERIEASATVAVTERAARMRAAGHDVIGLGAGEPDFDTPSHIAQAARAALDAGFTRYTAVDGIDELKAAIAHKFQRDNGLSFGPEELIVSNGAKQSLFNIFHVLLDAGDEVIVPAPYWVSYADIPRLAGGVPIIVQTSAATGFRMTAEQLDAAITPRTRLLALNSPCNPTGAVYTRAELAALGEVLERHPRVIVVSDEIYEHIYWGEAPYCSFATACPGLRERTILVNGVSKAYAMTGWRIGYAAAPAPLVAAMRKLQGQSTGNPGSIAQKAAAAAIGGEQTCVAQMTAAFRERHARVNRRLNSIEGLHAQAADGAFYQFIDCREAIASLGGVEDDAGLCEYLIERAGVALVPGAAFGAPGYVRLSFAAATSVLDEALSRIESALAG